MSGHRPFTELLAEVEAEPGARQAIDARKRAMREIARLSALRERMGSTRLEPLDGADATESNGVRSVREDGLYLSTLRDYVEALGGRLEITAVFPEGSFLITTDPSDR